MGRPGSGSYQRAESILTALLMVVVLDALTGRIARAEQPTTQPAAAASLQAAAEVIDLRTFPMLEKGELFHQTRFKVGYGLAKPSFDSDVKCYVDQLTAAGWKIDKQDVNQQQPYAILHCSKQGFGLNVSIVKNPNDGKMMAFVENYGNIDARTLPVFTSAKSAASQFNVLNYSTDGKVDAVAAFIREEMKKLGWRETVTLGGEPLDQPGESYSITFLQRGLQLAARVNKGDAGTEVLMHLSLLKLAVPIMPDVTGHIEYLEDPFVKVFYATKATPAEALAFYRKELTAIGWTMAAEGPADDAGVVTVALTGPDKEQLRLEVLGKSGLTHVLIASAGS